MAVKRVNDQDILKMNILFLRYKTKAEVARQTGFSASTVARYIIPNFIMPNLGNEEYERVEEPEINLSMFQIENWNKMTILTPEEHTDLMELRKEAVL